MATCTACAEVLPPDDPERCPSCGTRLVAAPPTPGPSWWPSRALVLTVVGCTLFMLVVVGALIARDRAMEREAARLLDPVSVAALPSSSALHARVGERWTFRRAKLYMDPTVEVWDVLQVDRAGVLYRVQPADGGPTRVERWSFDADTGYRPHVEDVRRETLVIGRHTIDCDRVQVMTGGGMERLWLWIAMDRVTGSPTFPGVVLRDTEGDRGQLCRELEVTSVAPITSP